jgi:hypothetical protein
MVQIILICEQYNECYNNKQYWPFIIVTSHFKFENDQMWWKCDQIK